MKTTLLFSAALFLATASFAQTDANSQATIKGKSEIKSDNVKAKADASTEAGLQANTIKEDHKAAASATANDKGKLVSGIASDKPDASLQGKEKGKLISSIASDGKSESGSADVVVKGNANANVNSNIKPHVKKIKRSVKKVKATSANTIHTGAAAVHAVKVPVSVKTNAGVGVHIK